MDTARPSDANLLMFDDPHKRTFFSAPQSITSLIAALLEPGISVLGFIVLTLLFDPPLDRPALTLCLLVLALTFPGRNRFRDNLLGAAVDIASSWATLIGILALCAYATQSFRYFESDVLLAWALLTPVLQWLATCVGRFIVLHRAETLRSRRTAIIVGASPLGVKVARALQAGVQGIEFLGFFDDRTDGRVDWPPRTRSLAAWPTSARTRRNVVFARSTSHCRSDRNRASSTCSSSFRARRRRCTSCPDVFGISIIQGRLQDMNGVPVVGICETPFTGTNQLMKRTSDLVLASLIIVLTSPLLLAIAIGVKLSSPGPVIFRQRRNGLDGDEIVVWKFRSMTTQDDGDVVTQATRNDPRVTRLGAFLRASSLDEMPQFFNVLQGRMSIVGPRPHAVTHNEQYRQIIKAYMVRHKVKPGITGWAQVNGQRGETDTVEKMRARVEYDLEYLRNWSLALDLRIIVGTVRLVFFDRYAY